MKSTLTYQISDDFQGDLCPGTLVKVPLGKQEIWGMVWAVDVEQPPGNFALKSVIEIEEFFKYPQLSIELFSWLAKYYQISPNRILDLALSRDWMKLSQGKVNVLAELKGESEGLKPLLPHQRQAFNQIVETSHDTPVLVHGITGSGKTRLYQEVISECTDLSSKILILVPEINLTPQTQKQIALGLGRQVELWHSNLGIRERRTTIQSILRGDNQIILGTRSSLLLPFNHLDLIIIDEEHDASYKQQDPAPRYHARELALMLARLSGARLIMGSATPSLESWKSAQEGRFKLIQMKYLAQGSGGATWTIVDMKQQRSLQGDKALSIPLRESIQTVVNSGRQVILLLNRRGFSRSRVCGSCGEIHFCLDCEVPLIYHKSKNALLCHYCTRTYPPTQPCVKCQSTEFVFDGVGIEQVEEELNHWIAGAKVLRLDKDTTSGQGSSQKILEAFGQGEANILLGTQMVAKGHDFPRVDLVGVVNADTGLLSPDFRASERNYQLLSQVAGRTGRHNLQGEKCQIILQSWQPEHPLFQDVKNSNFSQFMAKELESRRSTDFPPFMKLALVEVSSNFPERLQHASHLLMRGLVKRKGSVQGQVFGPIEAPIAKIKKRHRVQIMLKCPYANQLVWWIQQVMDEVEEHVHHSVILKWDMDPYSMS